MGLNIRSIIASASKETDLIALIDSCFSSNTPFPPPGAMSSSSVCGQVFKKGIRFTYESKAMLYTLVNNVELMRAQYYVPPASNPLIIQVMISHLHLVLEVVVIADRQKHGQGR
jgi:hypothetical protein